MWHVIVKHYCNKCTDCRCHPKYCCYCYCQPSNVSGVTPFQVSIDKPTGGNSCILFNSASKLIKSICNDLRTGTSKLNLQEPFETERHSCCSTASIKTLRCWSRRVDKTLLYLLCRMILKNTRKRWSYRLIVWKSWDDFRCHPVRSPNQGLALR